MFLDTSERFTEPLVVDDLAGAQELNGICNLGDISDYAENIVVGAAGFLFGGQVLMKVGDGISLGLEFTGVKGNAACGLGPDSHSVVDIVIAKAGFLPC